MGTVTYDKYIIEEIDHLIDIPAAEKEIIRDFYKRIIFKFAGSKLNTMKGEVKFIVVGHLVPTLPFYLEALSQIGTIAAIVPKGSKPDKKILDWLNKWIEKTKDGAPSVIVDGNYFRKKYGENKLDTRQLLAKNSRTLLPEWLDGKKGIIVDIGGYFALCLESVLQSDVIGIVEDTENGHQTYHKALESQDDRSRLSPLISVARSDIKKSEDYNVGKAITDAVDHILRVTDYTHLAESKTILVIGYGKIGSAAARVAAEKTRGQVLICEHHPVRKLEASAHSFSVVDTLELGLQKADIIICCTGKNCLKDTHLRLIKPNAYIASCTSKDGEFDETFVSALAKGKSQLSGDITRYTVVGKTINLLNNGDSVNFVQKAVHGYFIHGVLASLAVSAIRVYLESALPENEKTLKNGYLNDFNTLGVPSSALATSSQTLFLEYQSIISDLLLREKLRSEPLLTNHTPSRARYLAREKDIVEDLNKILLKKGRVHLTGGKKYGKSQTIEEWLALHMSRYDIVWRFHSSSPLEAQFKELITAINENERIIHRGLRIDTAATESASKQVTFALQKEDLSYLLIFENVEALEEIKQTGTNALKRLEEFIPAPAGKREHIIVTSSKNLDLGPQFDPLHLESFPFLALFKFLVNNDSLWEEEALALGRIAHSFALPLSPHNNYSKDESITPQGNDHELLVAVSQVFSSFIRKNPEYKWQEEFLQDTVPENGHIIHFLDKVIQTLEDPTKKLLYLFYAVDFGDTACSINKLLLEKFFRKLFVSTKSIEQLLEYGFIEEDKGIMRSVFHTQRQSQLASIKKHTDITPEYTSLCEEFIIQSTLKTFCETQQSSLQSMVKKIIETLDITQTSAPSKWKKADKTLYVKVLKKLGDFYLNNGRYQEAIDNYSKAVDAYKDVNGYPLHKVAKLYKKLADIYDIMHKAEPMIAELKKALTIYQELERPLDITSVQKKLIVPYSRTDKDIKEIRADFESAEAFFKAIGTPELATLYMDLAVAYKNKADFNQAGEYYELASSALQKFGVGAPETFQQNFGILLKRQGKYSEAVVKMKKLLEVRRAHAKKYSNSNHYINTLMDLGQIYEKLGNYNDALELLTEGKQMAKTLLGTNNFYYAALLSCLGRLHKSRYAALKQEEDKTQSDNYHTKAIQIFKKMDGKNQTHIKMAKRWFCETLVEINEQSVRQDLFDSKTAKDEINEQLQDENIAGDYKSELLILKARLSLKVEENEVSEICKEVISICEKGQGNLEVWGDAYALLALVNKDAHNQQYALQKYTEAFGVYAEKHYKVQALNKLNITPQGAQTPIPKEEFISSPTIAGAGSSATSLQLNSI